MLSRKIIAGLVKTPKQAFSTYKTSTGLVGLAVDLDGRQNLINISAQVLEAVQVCMNSIATFSVLSTGYLKASD